MRSVPGRRGQSKAGDILLETTKRDAAVGWLGADAEYQAALCVRAVGLLLKAEWKLPLLRALVEVVKTQRVMQQVVAKVHDRSPEFNLGRARPATVQFGGEVRLALPRAQGNSFTIEED